MKTKLPVRDRRPRAVRVLAASVLVTTLLGAFIGVPSASAAPVYPVMNTSEYPPDGVNFRSGPDWNARVDLNGYGVYAGESVRLNCWQSGSNVPRRDGGTNLIWYSADNISRPTAAGRANSGWINAHFVNDGTGPGQVAPGVPQCGSTPPPAPASVTSYFSPFAANNGTWNPGNAPTVRLVGYEGWTNPDLRCNSSKAVGVIGSTTRNLSGWSLGRLGTIYALAQANAAQLQQITNVLMIDPGNYSDLSGCDNQSIAITTPTNYQRPSTILSNWLKSNGSARLTILSGNRTAENSHQGIQQVYFNYMRAAGIDRSRVRVCNYGQQSGSWPNSSNHEAIFLASRAVLASPPSTSCPDLAGFTRQAPVNGWNP